MGKIKTVNQLADRLDKEIAWRIKEIASFKILYKQNVGLLQIPLARAGVALAYAHWEGFVKATVDHYLTFVTSQKIAIKDLAPCLVALNKRGLLHLFTETTKFESYARVVRELTEEPFVSERVSFAAPIRTANLRSEVFIDISSSIGVATSKYETRFNFIDVSLVDARNDIAHGEYFRVREAAFLDILDDVLSLIRLFKDDVENLAVLGAFRR